MNKDKLNRKVNKNVVYKLSSNRDRLKSGTIDLYDYCSEYEKRDSRLLFF